jgi:hypothetical protein
MFSDGEVVDSHSGSLACRNGKYIAHLFKSSMSKFHHLKKQTWVVMERAGTLAFATRRTSRGGAAQRAPFHGGAG